MNIAIKYELISVLKKIYTILSCLFFGALCMFSKVQNNKIVFCCHLGRNGINCNPKYIAKEIIRQKLPYELVWMCNKEFMVKDEEFKIIKFVDFNNKIDKFKALATSKVWVDNSYKPKDYANGLIKKKNQFYINTWHGSLGIKKIFWDSAQTTTQDPRYLKCLEKDFNNCDILLSNSKWEENVFRRAFRYKGKICRFGHPRNDIFFNENSINVKNKVYNSFCIPKDKKLVLYIPSFRANLETDCYDINYSLLRESLQERFGGEWVVATKFHPVNLKKADTFKKLLKADYDFSYYSDTQEVLLASDVIISDYSSCMFDFMLTKRPCFIYATDIQEYNVKRGFYYPLEETPFPIARDNEELARKILEFNNDEYIRKCSDFLQEKKALEDGNASKRVVEVIKEICR